MASERASILIFVVKCLLQMSSVHVNAVIFSVVCLRDSFRSTEDDRQSNSHLANRFALEYAQGTTCGPFPSFQKNRQ